MLFLVNQNYTSGHHYCNINGAIQLKTFDVYGNARFDSFIGSAKRVDWKCGGRLHNLRRNWSGDVALER